MSTEQSIMDELAKDTIQEMIDRLERCGDKLPLALVIQMRKSIAAYDKAHPKSKPMKGVSWHFISCK